jgi:hypothetical protein
LDRTGDISWFLQANGLGFFSPGQAGTPAPPWVKGARNEFQPEGLGLVLDSRMPAVSVSPAGPSLDAVRH